MIAQLNTDHVNSKNKENLDKMFHSRTQSDIEFTQSDSKLVPIMHQELLNFKKNKKQQHPCNTMLAKNKHDYRKTRYFNKCVPSLPANK